MLPHKNFPKRLTRKNHLPVRCRRGGFSVKLSDYLKIKVAPAGTPSLLQRLMSSPYTFVVIPL